MKHGESEITFRINRTLLENTHSFRFIQSPGSKGELESLKLLGNDDHTSAIRKAYRNITLGKKMHGISIFGIRILRSQY